MLKNMKKILTSILALTAVLSMGFVMAGCEKNGGNEYTSENEYGFTKSDAVLAFDSFISNFFETRGHIDCPQRHPFLSSRA